MLKIPNIVYFFVNTGLVPFKGKIVFQGTVRPPPTLEVSPEFDAAVTEFTATGEASIEVVTRLV